MIEKNSLKNKKSDVYKKQQVIDEILTQKHSNPNLWQRIKNVFNIPITVNNNEIESLKRKQDAERKANCKHIWVSGAKWTNQSGGVLAEIYFCKKCGSLIETGEEFLLKNILGEAKVRRDNYFNIKE